MVIILSANHAGIGIHGLSAMHFIPSQELKSMIVDAKVRQKSGNGKLFSHYPYVISGIGKIGASRFVTPGSELEGGGQEKEEGEGLSAPFYG